MAIILYDHQKHSLAHKLHSIASTLHSLFQFSHSLNDECFTMFSSFIRNIFSQSPPSSDEIPNDDTKIQSVVDRVISLVSLFVPEKDDKNLVSLHGTHVWHKTFSSLCPRHTSSYQLHPLSFPSTYISSSPPLLLPPLSPSSQKLVVDDLSLFDAVLFGALN